MNFSLNKHQEAYIEAQTRSGPFSNASEVVRDALRLHEEHYLRLSVLRQQVQQGVDDIEAGRISTAGPDDIIEAAEAQRRSDHDDDSSRPA